MTNNSLPRSSVFHQFFNHFSYSLLAGSFLGLIAGSAYIMLNGYLKHELFYLASLSLQDFFNYYVLLSISLGVITFLLFRINFIQRNILVLGAVCLVVLLISIHIVGMNNLQPLSPYFNTHITLYLPLFLMFSFFLYLSWKNRKQTEHVKVKKLSYLLFFIPLAVNLFPYTFSSHIKPPKTNVIFISIDALRPDHLGCYGYPRNTSPRIDALAQDALLFQDATVQRPKTSASFASIFTSTYPHTNGVRDCGSWLPHTLVTFVEFLRNSGFQTEACISNVILEKQFNFSQGFKNYSIVENDELKTNRAIQYIRTSKNNMFLWIHYMDVHAPYTPPEEYQDLFINDEHYSPAKQIECSKRSFGAFGEVPGYACLGPNKKVSYYLAQYDSGIRFVDSLVGKILKELKESKMYNDSIIILIADHGEGWGKTIITSSMANFPMIPAFECRS